MENRLSKPSQVLLSFGEGLGERTLNETINNTPPTPLKRGASYTPVAKLRLRKQFLVSFRMQCSEIEESLFINFRDFSFVEMKERSSKPSEFPSPLERC